MSERAQLPARFAWAIDARDWESLREVFSSDVVVDYEAFTCAGIDELVTRMRDLHEGLDVTQHLIGSVLVEGARVRSQVLATLVQRGRPGGSSVRVSARYDDEVHETPAGLRITRRTVRGVSVQGNRDLLPWLGGRTQHGIEV